MRTFCRVPKVPGPDSELTTQTLRSARSLGAPRRYEWALEGNTTNCFDEISHSALMSRVQRQISDKRVLTLIKAFLKAVIPNRDTGFQDSQAVPHMAISRLRCLASIALSVLNEHFDHRIRDQRNLPRQHQRSLLWFRLVHYANNRVPRTRLEVAM